MPASVEKPLTFLPDRPGRSVVLCSMEGCGPCDRVLNALRDHSDLATTHEVSKWVPGDSPLRSEHRRAGALHYPTVLLVDNGAVVGFIEGFWESNGEAMVEPFREFIVDGVLP